MEGENWLIYEKLIGKVFLFKTNSYFCLYHHVKTNAMEKCLFLEDLRIKHLISFIKAKLSDQFTEINVVYFIIDPELYGFDDDPDDETTEQHFTVNFVAVRKRTSDRLLYTCKMIWSCDDQEIVLYKEIHRG